MSDASRTLHIVTGDEALLSSARAATAPLEGWEMVSTQTVQDLMGEAPALGDVILLDRALAGGGVYEACRRLTGQTRCRTFVVVDRATQALAEPIALFCGATGILERPLQADHLRAALETSVPRAPLEHEARADQGGGGGEGAEAPLPEALFADLQGEPSKRLIDALVDPETSLFNYEFLTFKLDEEYKRAKRFQYPLSCVMLGFEGRAGEDVLRRLAGFFLLASRDTDVLGRFDESSFLFLLPNTGPDGAGVMARRIQVRCQEEGLTDLVGDRLELSAGISSCPHPEVGRREDLYARAREAFFKAREAGGEVEVQ